jgi:hypothetical protein
MNEALRTCDPLTFAGMSSAISSPESAGGLTPLTLPDGRVIDPCGLALALASLSARQVRELGLRTSGIYGRPGSTSSRSAALQSSLESRLRARLLTLGSTLYKLTWKAWVTPSHVSRFRLRASELGTSETEFTGWPTPIVNDTTGSTHCYGPKQPDGTRARFWKLPGAAKLAVASPWATPAARDWRSESASEEFNAKRWNHTRGKPLSAQATLAGQSVSGSTAGMESSGQLNPAHSRWLMGYPPAWDACAVTAMPSSRKPRRSSSVPIST